MNPYYMAKSFGCMENSHYLLVIDYFSRYIENRDSKAEFRKHNYCHQAYEVHLHGIPLEVAIVSDNGLQHSSREFAKISREYGSVHSTSSPKHPQSNGEAERGVQTVKAL